MSWYEKYRPTPFDTLPIHGLFFLSSDNPNLYSKGIFFEGQKKPMVEFPSGMVCPIVEADEVEYLGMIHLFDQLDLPYNTTRNEGCRMAQEIAAYMGYAVFALEDDKLAVHGFEDGQHLLITYDNDARYMIDVTHIPHLK